ncbi:MAG: hypothetical protein DRQ88_05660 [Epsilonproteobacteria bacterium]|nr:MAG: hypothetical protein DRQ88_05660 [Campylobacterota bacterium]
MKLQRFKFNGIYHSTILLLLTISLGISILFFWSKGFLNFENVTSIFEADITALNLQKRNDVRTLRVLLEQNKIRSAVKTIENLESDTAYIAGLTTESPKYYALQKNIKDSSRILNKLLSLPELSSVLMVLERKMLDLQSFVIENNWKTLTRITRRLLARTFPKKRSSMTLKKIPHLLANTKKQLDKMVAVTGSSKLKPALKELIYSKISKFKTEIKMLSTYLKKQNDLKKIVGVLSGNFKIWMKDLRISISYNKIQYQGRIKYLFGSLGLMVILLFLFWILGIWINRISLKKDHAHLENYLLNFIKEKLIYHKKGPVKDLSNEFNEELNKVQVYLEKRINLGLVFQETLPFPAILLDSNLLLVWSNNLFYKEWGIDVENKNMTWDFLQSFTNLGEDDPVLIALNKNLAGIYQIQVKSKANPDSIPYEMYVAPNGEGDNKHIMIFFYPLRSLQETLVQQTKSIVGPINRSLDALASNRFNGKLLKSIEKDFNVASIDGLFSKFQTLDQNIGYQRDELLNEVQNVEINLHDEIKIKEDLKTLVKENSQIQSKGFKKITEIKKNLINNVENRGVVENQVGELLHLLKDFLKKTEAMYTSMEESNGVVNENRKVLGKLLELRPFIKELQENRDNKIDGFNHLMIGIDVVTSKLEITLKGHNLEGLNNFKESILGIKNSLNKVSSNFSNLVGKMSDGDDRLVKAIRDFYEFQKEMESVTKKTEGLFEHQSIS